MYKFVWKLVLYSHFFTFVFQSLIPNLENEAVCVIVLFSLTTYRLNMAFLHVF